MILGVRTLDQLRDNLGAADLQLAPGSGRGWMRVSTPPDITYPYGFIAEMTAGRSALLD